MSHDIIHSRPECLTNKRVETTGIDVVLIGYSILSN